jgi:hypothetical protein
MPGAPNVSVAERLRARVFRPGAKLDPSQVVDMRLLPMRRGVHWEDGSYSEFDPDPFPGGLGKPPDNYEARTVPRKRQKRT